MGHFIRRSPFVYLLVAAAAAAAILALMQSGAAPGRSPALVDAPEKPQEVRVTIERDASGRPVGKATLPPDYDPNSGAPVEIRIEPSGPAKAHPPAGGEQTVQPAAPPPAAGP